MDLPDGYAATRQALHAVAEHVLAAARYEAVGRIGLEVAPGGFATPPFHGTTVAVDGADLVVTEGSDCRRGPLTTLRAAAELAGATPGLPAEAYRALTALDLDRPLAVDVASAAALAAWLELGDAALERFAAEIVADGPTATTLWPEHFDLAFSASEVNYGVSPGDDAIPEPYVYVGPWARPLPGDASFWNQSFGAALHHRDVASVEDVVGFFRAGWIASRT